MTTTRFRVCRALNALMVFLLCGVLVGAFIYQFEENQNPCSLCELQRLAMLAACIGGLLNIRIGIKPLHYGVTLLACIFGGGVSLRQISLHICPQFPTFGYPVAGLELYTWSFIVLVSTIIGTTILLLLYKPKDSEVIITKNHLHERFIFFLAFLVSLINIFITLNICGLGPCT